MKFFFVIFLALFLGEAEADENKIYGAIHRIAHAAPSSGDVKEHEWLCPKPMKVVDEFLYKAKEGDTLYSLAREYNLRIQDLARDNKVPIEELDEEKYQLSIGDEVRIRRRVYTPEEGIASFYGEGDEFAGKPRSDGEVYYPYQWAVAHKFFPEGTRVRIIHKETGAEVVAPVRDRGPYHGCERIVDLSPAVRDALGIPADQGLARVRVEPVFGQLAVFR